MARSSNPRILLYVTLIGLLGCNASNQGDGASGGSNWLSCQLDTDCEPHPDAVRCGDDGYCEDAQGERVTDPSGSDAGLTATGSGGPFARSTSQDGPQLCAGSVVDKVDLLFVVDDSQSMLEEQAALREQFPKLVRTLTSGERLNPDGSVRSTFPAVTSLHLGVVSTDMGLLGVEGVPSCENGPGKDGRLQSTGSSDPALSCDASYAPFLTYSQGDDPEQTVQDFRCVATLGTAGCGFEQPLEAGLKALWPAVDLDPLTGEEWIDPATGSPGNRILFLPHIDGSGRLGHGDVANAGFLRNDPGEGASLIAVILVTDEADCSSANTTHFTPPDFLPDGHPLQEQPINLRCFYNQDNLYGVERYINGLRALRPGNEDLVVFGAIVGVPTDLVQLQDAAGEPIDLDDASTRDQWYDGILSDQRMVQRVDETDPEVAKRNLVPSCQTIVGKAFPPRRIVEVARGFGPGGVVQSICDGDLGGAMDGIVDRIVRGATTACAGQ